MITSLRGGLVDIYENDKITDRFFVSGGFAEITETQCAVLADSITRQSELDPATADAALAEAKAAFGAADMADRDAYREASDRLISAQAMVDSILSAGRYKTRLTCLGSSRFLKKAAQKLLFMLGLRLCQRQRP